MGLPKPKSRRERYLAKMCGENVDVPAGRTREEKYLEHISKNGSSSGGCTSFSSVCYNANDYGISTDNDDNSDSMQNLMLTLSEKGGGIIFIPNGTYIFKKQMEAYSNVSVLGESIDNTILKVVRETDNNEGLALFYHQYASSRDDVLNNPIKSCFFKNFTVDMTDMYVKVWNTGNKAFYFKNVQDCVFEDLKLIGTPATALGVDCLKNTHINRIYCENCGRDWETGGEYGGAAIGIGAGLLDDESFTITNCICKNSGHFGIFVENQGIFNSNVYYGKFDSIIISNNKVIGSRGNGIGVRKCDNVVISNNSITDSAEDGIYLDQRCRKVIIQNNEIRNSGQAGITLRFSTDENDDEGTGIVMEDICIRNNIVDGNSVGFLTEGNADKTNKTIYMTIKGNVFSRNGKGIEVMKTATHEHTVVKENCYLNNTTQIDIDKALFTGRTVYNEVYKNTTALSYSDLEVGKKINPDGAEVEQSDCAISSMFLVENNLLEIYAKSPNGASISFAQYDVSKTFLERSSFVALGTGDEKHTGIKLNKDTKYVKVFIDKVNESTSYRFTTY